MDTSTIKRLHFKEAFEGISKIDSINSDEEYFKEIFDYSNRSILFVIDDRAKGYCVFITDTSGVGSNKVLTVENPTRRNVYLMRIDGVLFEQNSKCDCALFTDEELDFVEFKSYAANKTEEARIDNYNKCFTQLQLTVEEFKTRYIQIGLDLHTIIQKICAYAVFNPTVPNNNATEKALSRKFLDLTGIPLRFVNRIVIC